MYTTDRHRKADPLCLCQETRGFHFQKQCNVIVFELISNSIKSGVEMSNQTEQSNISDLESAASEDTGFEMRWNTDDLPEGMKRRKTHHHRHHRHSSGHARSHSSHHHSSRSHLSSTNRDSSRPEFEDLLFRTDPSDSAAGKKESEHEEITTGASQPTAIKTGKTGNEKRKRSRNLASKRMRKMITEERQ